MDAYETYIFLDTRKLQDAAPCTCCGWQDASATVYVVGLQAGVAEHNTVDITHTDRQIMCRAMTMANNICLLVAVIRLQCCASAANFDPSHLV